MWAWICIGCIVFVVIIIFLLGPAAAKKQQQKELENKKQEKNKKQELILLGAQDVLDAQKNCEQLSEYMQEVRNKLNELDDYMRNEIRIDESASDKLKEELDAINDKADKTLSYYDELTDGGKTNDANLNQLLSVYRRKKNIADKEYLAVLQKCREQKLGLVKELYSLDDQRRAIFEEKLVLDSRVSEWHDVLIYKNNRTWKNTECEKFYNMIDKLIHVMSELDSEFDQNNPIYKERKKKFQQYSMKSILAFRGEKCVNLGRKDNRIAVWNSDDYQGVELSIDDILYFQIEKEMQTNTHSSSYTSSTGNTGKLGTAIDEAIWGTAAATASAMQKDSQNTTTFSSTYTTTEKKAIIYFKRETGMQSLIVPNLEVDKLIVMMPEKQR